MLSLEDCILLGFVLRCSCGAMHSRSVLIIDRFYREGRPIYYLGTMDAAICRVCNIVLVEK